MKAIFVGYADKHAGNVYRFINPSTTRIILSHDVNSHWLVNFSPVLGTLIYIVFQNFLKDP